MRSVLKSFFSSFIDDDAVICRDAHVLNLLHGRNNQMSFPLYA